jgi:hypothetical protein
MQEIPPDLEGFLADEEKTLEEKDEERGSMYAGEQRSDRTMARNEFFDGENDVDHDVVPQSVSKANTTRRTRAPRQTRGRSKGKGTTLSNTTPAEGEDDTEESAATIVKKGRARPKARGRGRPKNAEKEKENPDPDAPTGIDVDVDI